MIPWVFRVGGRENEQGGVLPQGAKTSQGRERKTVGTLRRAAFNENAAPSVPATIVALFGNWPSPTGRESPVDIEDLPGHKGRCWAGQEDRRPNHVFGLA